MSGYSDAWARHRQPVNHSGRPLHLGQPSMDIDLDELIRLACSMRCFGNTVPLQLDEPNDFRLRRLQSGHETVEQ
jgi:hypothetical protein